MLFHADVCISICSCYSMPLLLQRSLLVYLIYTPIVPNTHDMHAYKDIYCEYGSCLLVMLAYIDLFIIFPLFAWSADTQSEQCVFGVYVERNDITKYYDASAACRIYGKWSARYIYIWVNMLLWFFKADYTTHDSAQWFNKPEEITKKKKMYV